jgi:signal transduction histidine kinase
MTLPLVDNGTSRPTLAFDGKHQYTKVLLVEDSASDAQLVRLALSDPRERDFYGPVFDIRSATSLSKAMTYLSEEDFDVILLDLSLPDSQSLDQSFNDIHKRVPHVPIIVLTGLGDEDLGLRMIRDGAQDYLVKSRVERYVLVKAIRYAIERQLAKSAQQQLRLKLVTVQEEQRHRIARELHDQMGQSIAALMLGLKSLAHSYEAQEQARLQFQQLQNIANDLAREVHSLALDLRPTALDDLGLEVALCNYVEAWSSRWQIPSDFHSNGFTDQRLASHLETTIYRIAQEALTNVARHASAQTVSLILERADDRIGVIIEDDGCGFDVATVIKNPAKDQRLGLLGMEERVALVGGSLTIESTRGTGTSVYVRIPNSIPTNGELAQWRN